MAIETVKDGMSKARAAKTYNVRQQTLTFRCQKAEEALKVKKPGGITRFKEDEEQYLVDYIVTKDGQVGVSGVRS